MLSHWVDISFRDFIRPWIFCDQAKGYQNQRGKSLMVPSVIDVLLAFSIDFAVGDPPRVSHPVILMGRAIYMFESILRSPGKSERLERLAGTVLALSVICGSYVICKLVIELAVCINPLAGRIVSLWLMSTTLAARDLKRAAFKVYVPLMNGNLPEARFYLGMIVGRDTESLDCEGIVRATVETVAENTADGVIAPLLYGFIGGAPLAMAYKAVNTLDSMVGYKNERYLHLGWASAKLDDVANYIPARVSGCLLVIASFVTGFDARRAASAILSSAGLHPSPNSGVSEAAVAGALGIRLGGLNYYDGVPSFRGYLGEALQPLEVENIRHAVNLMYVSSIVGVVTGTGILAAFYL